MKLRRSFKIDLITVFTLLIVVSILLVVCYTYHKSSQAAFGIATELTEKTSAMLKAKTAGHIYPAMLLARFIAMSADGKPDIMTNHTELEKQIFHSMQLYSQVEQLYLGDEYGNYIMVTREEDGSISTKIIFRTGSRPEQVWHYRDTEGHIIKEERSFSVDFDPRERAWYFESKEKNSEFWTDIYPFYTGKQLGITAASPIRDSEGEFIGVAGADISLADLSVFLDRQQISHLGHVFIVKDLYKVVAFPGGVEPVQLADGTFRLKQVHDLGYPVIEASFEMYQEERLTSFDVQVEGVRSLVHITPVGPPFGEDWSVVIIVPEDHYVGALKRTQRQVLCFSAIILLLAYVCAVILARLLSKPIEQLSKEAKRIKDFDLDGELDVRSGIREIQIMTESFAAMKTGLRSFRKYVPATLVRQLIQTGEDVQLGGRSRELTIFFSDISGFTSISEQMEPGELMIHLSNYLEELSSIITTEQGNVIRYIGDSIMAFFGAPIPNEDHPLQACSAAVECCRKVEELNCLWSREGKPAMPTRFGIHTGRAIVGNIGSSDRLQYGAIGDSVNLASRLESANKQYGTKILISEDTYESAKESFVLRPLDRVAVKGRNQGVLIYELMSCLDGSSASSLKQLASSFRIAFESYLNRRWDETSEILQQILEEFPDDRPAEVLLERCRTFINNDPGAEWDGIFRLMQK